jgi:hypothetical protein
VPVGDVAAGVGHVDVALGVVWVRLRLADERAPLVSAGVPVTWCPDDHGLPPGALVALVGGPGERDLSSFTTRTIVVDRQALVKPDIEVDHPWQQNSSPAEDRTGQGVSSRSTSRCGGCPTGRGPSGAAATRWGPDGRLGALSLENVDDLLDREALGLRQEPPREQQREHRKDAEQQHDRR